MDKNIILVFNRMSPEYTPIEDMLGNKASDAVVLCPEEHKTKYKKVKQTIGFENYIYNDEVEKTANDIAKKHKITAVIATSEFDLVRSGKIRDLLGIDGQTELSAKAYRDKFLMKQLIRKAGIDTASFLSLKDNFDISYSSNLLKFTFVIKPRKGVGSRGVEIIKNEKELLNWVNSNSNHSDMMVEEYMDCPMFHVDGLFANDKIYGLTVSKYLGSCLGVKSGKSLGSIQYRESTVLFQKIEAATNKILRALPTPSVTPFHLEVFVDSNNTVFFSEIASRVAGGNIDQIVKLKNNLDLTETWVKYQLNKDLDNLSKINISDDVFGLIIFPPKMGILKRIATKCDLPYIVKYIVKNQVGDSFHNIESSVDCIAYAIIKGVDELDLENKLTSLNHWFYQNLEILEK